MSAAYTSNSSPPLDPSAYHPLSPSNPWKLRNANTQAMELVSMIHDSCSISPSKSKSPTKPSSTRELFSARGPLDNTGNYGRIRQQEASSTLRRTGPVAHVIVSIPDNYKAGMSRPSSARPFTTTPLPHPETKRPKSARPYSGSFAQSSARPNLSSSMHHSTNRLSRQAPLKREESNLSLKSLEQEETRKSARPKAKEPVKKPRNVFADLAGNASQDEATRELKEKTAARRRMRALNPDMFQAKFSSRCAGPLRLAIEKKLEILRNDPEEFDRLQKRVASGKVKRRVSHFR